MADGCVFCAIVRDEEPVKLVIEWRDEIAIVPLNPVVEGHVIVLPKRHVQDALVDPVVTAGVMARSQMAGDPRDLVGKARVRIFSGALGHEHVVMAEGDVIGYADVPTLLIRHADGTRSSWNVTLPREVIGPFGESPSVPSTKEPTE